MNDFSGNPRPPSGTIRIDGVDHPVYPGPTPPNWLAMAVAKGFDLVARIDDKNYTALACRACGTLNRVHAHVLRAFQPTCRGCLERDWTARARAAGAELLRRCENHRHYAWLRLPCGHEVRRQMGAADRVADGRHAFRCEICLGARETAEADARGWRLIGKDPKGNPSYRLYAHVACGHVQRVARGNMQSGRFTCNGCGAAWPAAPSAIYLMGIELPGGERVVKFGMSRDPEARRRSQLARHEDVRIELLDQIALRSGRAALRLEKGIHTLLRRRFPDQIVPPSLYAEHLKLRSEVYRPTLEPQLRAAFDHIRRRLRPPEAA